MKAKSMECGFYLIPYIYKGEVNSDLSQVDLGMAEMAMRQLEIERKNHRLADNYTPGRLHFDKMFLYNVIFDKSTNSPVFVSGTQVVGQHCVRVFSRYFVFEKFKTDHAKDGLFNKVDNFEELNFSLVATEADYPFVVWSRDRGEGFFKRLIRSRRDIFKNWILYGERIEFLYPDNFQNILYLNRGGGDMDKVIEEELIYKI